MKKALVIISFISILFLQHTATAEVKDLFGAEGYFHPFITVEQSWSDNIYNTEKNKTDDFKTTTSPGFWLALPGSGVFNPSSEDMGTLQALISYNPDFINYSDKNDHDDIVHNLEAKFFYNGAGGLTLKITDIFSDQHDDIIENVKNTRYTDNTAEADINYEASEKISFGINYSLFTKNYEKIKDSQDREESRYTASVHYGLLPKTSVFLQVSQKNIEYENLINQDSDETDYLAGIKWDITDKTTGSFKAGYLNKSFDDDGISDKSFFKMVLEAAYDISEKTSISLNAKNETNETDVLNATYIETSSVYSAFRHSLTERFTTAVSIYYNIEDYDVDRKDTTFNAAPSLQYRFNDFISCDLAYTYEDVESEGVLSDSTYTSNIVLLSFSASI